MKKKHQTQRTNLQELTQLFEEFNEMYNNNFFLLNTNPNKDSKDGNK